MDCLVLRKVSPNNRQLSSSVHDPSENRIQISTLLR